ncbi:PfkB family carbohydrate kinase [Pseudarthrobacter sp. Y6]|uniref:PfkB family carbohydrate kinase n=1 Tax=Pseudarthrobacter sp. Y6 TaxID=3418422 RepID=UPI003CE8DBBE
MALQRGALAPELAAAAEAAGVSAAAVHVDLASEESVAAATAEAFAGRQVDILVRCRAGEGDKVTFTDVVTLGGTMGLMKAEKPGPLAQVSSLSLGMGGSESNFAIALRRLGTSVTWVGRVGNDSLGELVLRELAAEGIMVDPLRDESAPTGLMIKERRTMDQLKVWDHRSGSAGPGCPGRTSPPSGLPTPGCCTSRASLPRCRRGRPGREKCALDIAREAGVLVSFDLNYRAALWPAEEAREVVRNFIAQTDVVFAGDDEAAIAVGASEDSLELARRVAALGPSQAVIKRRAAGVGITSMPPIIPRIGI